MSITSLIDNAEAATVRIVRELHELNLTDAEAIIERAAQIGMELSALRDEMRHGTWTRWCEAWLPFSARTARDYMAVHRRRADIQTGSALPISLRGALASIRKAKPSASAQTAAPPAVTERCQVVPQRTTPTRPAAKALKPWGDAVIVEGEIVETPAEQPAPKTPTGHAAPSLSAVPLSGMTWLQTAIHAYRQLSADDRRLFDNCIQGLKPAI